MTGAGRRLARKRWPWPNSLRRPGSSPDYDYPLSRAHVDVRPLVLRAALLNLKYSASQPPRTDCPNLAASHLCRSIPWAWASTPHSLYNVIQWSVHIPELHSATKSESSKDRGWKHTINNDHQIALELWHKSRARLTRRVRACAFVCAALICASRPPPCSALRWRWLSSYRVPSCS